MNNIILTLKYVDFVHLLSVTFPWNTENTVIE